MKKITVIILAVAFLNLTGHSCLAGDNYGTINRSPAVKYSLMEYSPIPPDLKHSKEYYLKKSKRRKTAAWIELAVGGACLGVYAAKEINNKPGDDDYAFDFSSTYNDILGVFGGICILGSIFDFIGSANNARKAASISLNMQQIKIPQQNVQGLKSTPTLCLRINF